MKHIQLFEDFRILKDTPKWFYLVLRISKAWESLLKMEFDGLIGISDNPNIIKNWFDIRDTLLIMRGDEFLKLNTDVFKVDYGNTNKLVSNNFQILNRLLQNKEDDIYYSNIIEKIFTKTELEKTTDKKFLIISKFLKLNRYEYASIIEDEIKNHNKKINNH